MEVSCCSVGMASSGGVIVDFTHIAWAFKDLFRMEIGFVALVWTKQALTTQALRLC
jgi:hypothetical protein